MVTFFASLFCGCGGCRNNERVTTVEVEEFNKAGTMGQAPVPHQK